MSQQGIGRDALALNHDGIEERRGHRDFVGAFPPRRSPLRAGSRLFLSVAALGPVPDDAPDMGLLALGIDDAAHGFAIDGEAVVGFAMDRRPALERAVAVLGIDADGS